MPGKFVIVSILFLTLLFANLGGNYAWAVPPPSNTPTPPPRTTCDKCGWCNKTASPSPPPPPRWQECMNCMNTPRRYWTVFGCLSTDPSAGPFTQSLLKIVFGVAGGAAFLSFLAGSVLVLTSSGNSEMVQTGKEIITSSLIGIGLVILSVFLMRVVGVTIFQIPGFG